MSCPGVTWRFHAFPCVSLRFIRVSLRSLAFGMRSWWWHHGRTLRIAQGGLEFRACRDMPRGAVSKRTLPTARTLAGMVGSWPCGHHAVGRHGLGTRYPW